MTLSRRPRTLLLTFDAFNTLFHPRIPVVSIYVKAAEEVGLLTRSQIPNESLLNQYLKHSLWRHNTFYPNYGRGLPDFTSPKVWWESVICDFFAAVMGKAIVPQDLPEGLTDSLYTTFAGPKGYQLYEDVPPFFEWLKSWKIARSVQLYPAGNRLNTDFDRVIVGVISNADNRIMTVLNSLRLRVGIPLEDDLERPHPHKQPERKADIDFVLTSYEAGCEKPDKAIFDLAVKYANRYIQASGDNNYIFPGPADKCIHVGDDFHDDHLGAVRAGWTGILLLRNGENSPVNVPDTATQISGLNRLSKHLRLRRLRESTS
ncbi:hypothetical protein LOZ53_002756 [Ophidiomyces ophidiicola]|nr:hypothetical protein LOZ55_004994 [Ophidiomyces ophidiicola]KAI1986785.1 hypothetical protein LOZ51_005946 [Ophidiomyces ophidiicola]KAI1991683.1 hypothetical protein LOZ53_002756 [Ophidiomyces ophidiicola]KAI1996391.1 hypothetical protein LOZ54_000264 [Ophidiomyces ophidiicola]